MPYVPGVSRSGAATIAPVPSMFRFASYFSYITCQCSGLPSSPVIIIHLINLVGESGIRCCPVEDIPGTWIRRRLLQIGSEIIDLYLQSRSASGVFRPGRFHKSTMVFLWSGFGPFQRAPNSSPRGRFIRVLFLSNSITAALQSASKGAQSILSAFGMSQRGSTRA